MLKNIMETIVSNKLDELADKITMCNCSKCRADIMAYTLNHLPPKYVASSSGELYVKAFSLLSEEVHEVTIILLKAIQIVSDNPRHETNEVENSKDITLEVNYKAVHEYLF